MRHVRIRYPKSLHPDTWEAIYAASVVGCFLRGLRRRSAVKLTDLCRCGHSRDHHHRGFLFSGGACTAMVDRRHATAAGDLSPCECKVFEPVSIRSDRG